MKIAGFFKIKLNSILAEKPKEKETVEFNKLSGWINMREKEIEALEKKASSMVLQEISEFKEQAIQKIELLKKVSLDKKNEDNRIKHLVLTNKSLYIDDFEKLLSETDGWKNLGFDELVKTINSSFLDFKKRSVPKYQKATYLIGKEIGDVNECIIRFMMEYSKILKDSESFVLESKTLASAKEHIEKIKALDKESGETEEKGNKDAVEIKSLRQKLKELHSQVEGVKNSKEYLENISNVEKQKNMIIDINKEINSLKLMIDFKALSEMFHSSEKYRHIVKDFRESFGEHFREDNGQALMNLLNEAKLNSDLITNKIEAINSSSEELSKLKSMITNDKTMALEGQAKRLESEITTLTEYRLKATKRIEKIKSQKDEIATEIKTGLEKINVVLKNHHK